MRRYLFQTMNWMVALVILCQGVAYAETVSQSKKAPLFRHSSYPAAWTAAQESNRPILIYVSMPQCPHCEKMVNKTFERRSIKDLVSGSFETVYAGRYTHAELVKKLSVKWYPTTVLVSPNNKVLDVIEGYVDAAKFKRHLQTGLAAVGTDSQTR